MSLLNGLGVVIVMENSLVANVLHVGKEKKLLLVLIILNQNFLYYKSIINLASNFLLRKVIKIKKNILYLKILNNRKH